MQGQEMPTWQFTPGQQRGGSQTAAPDAPVADKSQSPSPPSRNPNAVTWTASEYVSHSKGFSWYVLFGFGAVVLAVLAYVVTEDKVPTAVILICAILMGVLGAKKPRVLDYAIDDHGITIANKFYPFADFKSFGVIEDIGVSSIVLAPLKRFMPDLTVYIDKDDEDRIARALANYLPFEERDHDLLERLMSRLRF